jgi:hemoglobin
MQTQEKHSLNERFGGAYNSGLVVDDFINRIMDDPRLNANLRVDEAHQRFSSQGFKYLFMEMVCWAAGGPQPYSGWSIRDLYYHLLVTDQEWRILLDDFQQTLTKFRVREQEADALKAIVESTQLDRVTSAQMCNNL